MKRKKNVLKNCMLCSVLVNIDPQKKVIRNIYIISIRKYYIIIKLN